MNTAAAIALSRLTAQSRAMDVIAGNIANMSTPGYHAERMLFSDWLSRQPGARDEKSVAYTQDVATYRDRAEGALTHTGNPLDLALTGEGFFTVQTQAGTRLTRAGRFTLQSTGAVTDEAGNPLLDDRSQPIRISTADTDLSVTSDGALSSQNGPIARLGISKPVDSGKITAEGGRLFRADGPTVAVARPHVVQGAVEDSNVQPIGELTAMIGTQREFGFVEQFVDAEDQRQQSAIDKIASPDV